MRPRLIQLEKEKKMARKSLPLSKVDGLLEPAPVVMLTRMVARHGFFVLEVVKAWIDPAVKNPRTIHHLGKGNFMLASAFAPPWICTAIRPLCSMPCSDSV